MTEHKSAPSYQLGSDVTRPNYQLFQSPSSQPGFCPDNSHESWQEKDPGWSDHDHLLQLIIPSAGDTRGGGSWWLEVVSWELVDVARDR